MQMICFLFIIVTIKFLTIQSQCPLTRDYIQGRLNQVYIPGAAIIVVNRKDILYQEGFGYYSPLETEQPRRSIDPISSIFMLASISKTFVIVAAMQLVETKHLDLDVDINQYLPSDMNISHPNFPNVTITVRHLLSHTAGIGSNTKLEFQHLLPGDSFTQAKPADIIKQFLSFNESWLPIPPGNITSYSNVGVALAAFIIECLSEIRFEQYVHEKLLNVLNITENKSGYRLSNFQNQTQNLVDHYLYNASWLEFYSQEMPQLNVSRVIYRKYQIYGTFFSLNILRQEILPIGCISLFLVLIYTQPVLCVCQLTHLVYGFDHF